MLPVVFLIFSILFVLFLCVPIRCCVSVLYHGKMLLTEIRIKLFFGLINLRFCASINILDELAKIIKRKQRKKKNLKPLEVLNKAVEKKIIKHIEIRSKTGIKNDAFLTVMAVGFMRIFFEKLACAVGLNEKAFINITPCFAANVFWIHLEGIVVIFPTQIIGIMVLKGR